MFFLLSATHPTKPFRDRVYTQEREGLLCLSSNGTDAAYPDEIATKSYRSGYNVSEGDSEEHVVCFLDSAPLHATAHYVSGNFPNHNSIELTPSMST